MDQQPLKNKSVRAFVTLTSVIILSSIGMVMATNSLLANTDALILNGRIYDSIMSRSLSFSCAEVALNKLKDNTSYSGNETIILPFGTCTIQTITGSGNTNRVITTNAVQDGVYTKSEISVQQINPNTLINYWREIP